MIERTPAEIAGYHLQRIVEREPLYRPAAFTLGYLRLRDGDNAEAEHLFSGLTEPYNTEADLKLADAKEKFPRTGLKYAFIFTWIKPIGRRLLPWLEQWQHIQALLNGGTLYSAAQDWAVFDQHLAESEDPSKKGDPFVQESFKVYIKGFPEMAGIRKFVRIVAGLETGNKAQARDTLDSLVAAEKIRDLDHQLRLLESKVKSARVASSARDFYKITGDESATPRRISAGSALGWR